VKTLKGIVIYQYLTCRLLWVLALLLLLSACATVPTDRITPPPLLHAGPAVEVEDIDVLLVSPEMDRFLDRYILNYEDPRTRLELLIRSVMVGGNLGFEYDEARTLTASEAFRTRSGNCVGFSNMIVALARQAGLAAQYQEVFLRPVWSDHLDDTVLLVKHVNVVVKSRQFSWAVDVSGVEIHPTDRRRIVDDSYAKALYLNNLAVDALLKNDLPTAYAYMRSAIDASSEAVDPWVNLGVIYGRNDQLDDAAQAFQQALKIEPGDFSALSNLYEIYLEQEKFALAAELEPRVERYRRNNPYYLLRLSDEALALEQYQESISLLKKAIKRKEDDHKLYFALAKTQYLSGKMTAAQKSLLRARELAPEDMLAYYERPLGELVAEQLSEQAIQDNPSL
jgi:tetratricopeptide (TPR) repeat protein